MLPDIILPLESHLKGQAELRAHISSSRYISFSGGRLVSNQERTVSGVSARVRRGGVYGFASEAEVTTEAALRVLRAAEGHADFLNERLRRAEPPLPPVARRDFFMPHTPKQIDQKLLIDYARALDERIAKKYPDLLSRSVTIRCECEEKALITGDASRGHQFFPRVSLYIGMIGSGSSGTAEHSGSLGGGGYFIDHFSDPAELDALLDDIYTSMRRKTEGVHPNAGLRDVVLDSSLAGILAHEALGHTVEADWARFSVAMPNLGKKVASELISLTDFAHTAFGGPLSQPVYMDEEGTPARDAEIIRDGVLVGLMHDRTSAAALGMEPTGNARAQTFADEPLIRMRNTCIHPGKSGLEEMIASVEDGYYLKKEIQGQADTTGEFMFVISEGYEIKKGKLGRAILGATISGFAFDVLGAVDMVGNEMSWSHGGMCGKKQQMQVSMGGPAIKTKINIGGR